MSNRNNQIVEILLSVLSKELDLSMDELRSRCGVDEVALEVDRYIAEHPEKFGAATKSNEEIDPDSFTDSVSRFGDAPPASPLDPLLVPEPVELSFLIDLDAIFPFSDDEISLSFDEYDGRLSISTVISAKDEQYEARADAVERFLTQSPRFPSLVTTSCSTSRHPIPLVPIPTKTICISTSIANTLQAHGGLGASRGAKSNKTPPARGSFAPSAPMPHNCSSGPQRNAGGNGATAYI